MSLIVEPARPTDAADLSRLLRDYLTTTEQEKTERALTGTIGDHLLCLTFQPSRPSQPTQPQSSR